MSMDGNGEICIEGEKVILMLYLHFETPLTSSCSQSLQSPFISSHYPTVLLACGFTGSLASHDGTKVGGTGAREVLLF